MRKINFEFNGKKILITGAAGFIGAASSIKILSEFNDVKVVGVDNMNDYYDVSLKEYRLKTLLKNENFTFIKGDVSDKTFIDQLFEKFKFDLVINLAAQAGVRYSIDHPDAYIKSNVIGFYNILEACRHNPVKHLVFASSSSVYGGNEKVPYSTEDKTDSPVSLYAATKKSDELLAYAYAKLYDIPTTGLRFFTVYGPAGRPDMAYFSFTDKLIKGDKVKLYNFGNCKRDFTYIDDVVNAIIKVSERTPERKKGQDGLPIAPFKIYNVGNGAPESLLDFIDILQDELLKFGVLPKSYDFNAHKELVPMQPGDVPVTFADTTALERDTGFKPETSLRAGLSKFAEWHKNFYKD